MNININEASRAGSVLYAASRGDNEFRRELDEILSGNVIISPKIEARLDEDPELSENIVQEIRRLGGLNTSGSSVVIVNRRGEVSRYSFDKDRRESHPTAEELKAVARARARRQARLDAYFHLLERVSIKRKLIEQENARRFLNKKYRASATQLDSTARARQITPLPLDPSYFL